MTMGLVAVLVAVLAVVPVALPVSDAIFLKG